MNGIRFDPTQVVLLTIVFNDAMVFRLLIYLEFTYNYNAMQTNKLHIVSACKNIDSKQVNKIIDVQDPEPDP